MEQYINRNGNSPITHYLLGEDYITVWFNGSKDFTYSANGAAGKYHVDNMGLLAESGIGLNAYIKKNVQNDYDI